ncbi:hypothetical protein BRC83_02150 [Halobacteriales archaeon QS_1_68_17]|nr:MAG: hypothetical protein BRC83_02150 [Halobacteriales archaeon QS_1_68_17]
MPSGDSGEPEDGKILSPEELDIGDDEHVREIGDARYVVSADSRLADAGEPVEEPERDPAPEPEAPADPDEKPAELNRAEVHEWLADHFSEIDARYGFDVTGAFDGSVQQRQMVSNDVVAIFESLVLWYAQQIDTDTPVEEVLGILLVESNVPIQYPAEELAGLVESSGLGPDDSIGKLLVANDDGFRL